MSRGLMLWSALLGVVLFAATATIPRAGERVWAMPSCVPPVVGMYAVTTHFLGQQYVDVDGERATGETYCLAHHLSGDGDEQHNHVMSIRYLDDYQRVDGRWLIARRRLVIDWTEDRQQARH